MSLPTVSFSQLLPALKAVAEETRLRLLLLLATGELSVKDLCEVTGQSQPRISRHLKLLTEAGLITRFREGSWAFFRLNQHHMETGFLMPLLSLLSPHDDIVKNDAERLRLLRVQREQDADSYFAQHAAEWNFMRGLYVDQQLIEAHMMQLVTGKKFDLHLDLGTGTGRLLSVFSSQAKQALGIDKSPDMLSLARVMVLRENLSHAQVRQGDLLNLPVASHVADFVTLYQVLHFFDHPAKVLDETSRVMVENGLLMVVDFAPHDLEFLREQHAHRRLGFSRQAMQNLLQDAGFDVLDVRDVISQHNNKTNNESLTVNVWLAQKK